MSDKFYDFWIGSYKVRLSDDEQTAEVYLEEKLLHTTTTSAEGSATVRAQKWIGLHRCGRSGPEKAPETPTVKPTDKTEKESK